MTKADTLKLQRAINAEFGWGLREDGIYGPKTAEAYQYYLNQKTPHNVPTPAPVGAKPWWTSRALIGTLIAFAALGASYWGVEIDVEQATTLVASAGGLVVALIGTVRRRAPIDSGLMAPGVRYPAPAAPVPPDGPADRPTGPFGF